MWYNIRMELECAGCNRPMNIRPYRVRVNKGRGIYCSKECRHQAAFGDITCKRCGTIFQAYYRSRQYCSLTCRQPWNKGRQWSQDVKAKISQRVVARGGMSGSNNPRWNPTITVRKCKTCRRMFRPKDVSKVKKGYGIYCSKACYQKAKGETVPEQLVRKALNALGELYQPQAIIGFWTVDFLLPFRTTVIEVDGNYWHNLPGAARRDKAKTTYLTNRGFRVLRFGETVIREDAPTAIKAAL